MVNWPISNSHRALLGVNIDHIATLRQARGTRYPDPVQAAIEVEEAGADAVTLHLREDRRHIQERDVRIIKEVLQTRMNLEMAVTDEMLAIAESIQPQDCCLVPERREELTTEGGLDVAGQKDKITAACDRLAAVGTKVSLFIDADRAQIDAAKACGAPCIELHTGHYADAKTNEGAKQEYNRLCAAVDWATSCGLQVNAGHGLHYQNTAAIACIPQIQELNIGHAIVARAVFSGLKPAIREMLDIMRQARS